MTTNVIWIDQNIDSQNNILYGKELESMNSLKVKYFKIVEEAFDYLKTLKFEEVKVIVGGRLYSEFVQALKENIEDINVAPKIIVFTRNELKFLEYNPDFKSDNNKFYSFGGIAIFFSKIKDFLNIKTENSINSYPTYSSEPINNYLSNNTGYNTSTSSAQTTLKSSFLLNESNIQLTFEYIDSKEKLLLPLFFKSFK